MQRLLSSFILVLLSFICMDAVADVDYDTVFHTFERAHQLLPVDCNDHDRLVAEYRAFKEARLYNHSLSRLEQITVLIRESRLTISYNPQGNIYDDSWLQQEELFHAQSAKIGKHDLLIEKYRACRNAHLYGPASIYLEHLKGLIRCKELSVSLGPVSSFNEHWIILQEESLQHIGPSPESEFRF